MHNFYSLNIVCPDAYHEINTTSLKTFMHEQSRDLPYSLLPLLGHFNQWTKHSRTQPPLWYGVWYSIATKRHNI